MNAQKARLQQTSCSQVPRGIKCSISQMINFLSMPPTAAQEPLSYNLREQTIQNSTRISYSYLNHFAVYYSLEISRNYFLNQCVTFRSGIVSLITIIEAMTLGFHSS